MDDLVVGGENVVSTGSPARRTDLAIGGRRIGAFGEIGERGDPTDGAAESVTPGSGQ